MDRKAGIKGIVYGLIVLYAYIFLAYFTLLDNQLTIFLAFFIFLALGCAISNNKRLVVTAFALSIAFMAIGGFFEFVSTRPAGVLLQIFEVTIVVLVFALWSMFVARRIGAFAAFSLMLALAVLGIIVGTDKLYTFPNFYNNLIIIGYYLLISAVIGMFLAVQDGKILKFFKRLGKSIAWHDKLGVGIAVVLIAILLLPVWYIGYAPNQNVFPYTYVKLYSNNSNIGNNFGAEYFLINSTKYYGYISNSSGNLAFFSSKGTPLYAYIERDNGSGFIRVFPISAFGATTWTNSVKLVFSAYNSSQDDFLLDRYNATYPGNYILINSSSAEVYGNFILHKFYRQGYVTASENYSRNQSIVIDNSDSVLSECLNVVQANMTIEAQAVGGNLFSIFIFRNSSAYSKAYGVQFISINNSLYPYPGFSEYSVEKALNTTKARFNFNIGRLQGCFYIGIIATHEEHISVDVNGPTKIPVRGEVAFYAPEIIVNQTPQYKPYFGSILNGIYYLYTRYEYGT